MPLTGLTRVWRALTPKLHLLVMLPTLAVLASSPFLMIARRLRNNASVWELTHVYLGLLLVPLSLLLLIFCVTEGRARQFFPLFAPAGVFQDIKGLAKGQLPKAGGRGLFSLIEGICVLLLVASALTGLGWYLCAGGSEALCWRTWHQYFGLAFGGCLIIHVVAALSHLVDLLRA